MMSAPTSGNARFRTASTTSSAVATSSPGTSVGASRTRNAAAATNAAERPRSAQPARDDDDRSVLVHDLLLGAVFVHASHARSRSAPAHRPRLSSRSAPTTILARPKSAAALMRPAVTQRYVGRMSGRRIPQSSRLGDLVLAVGLALLALAEIWWPGGFVASGPIEGNAGGARPDGAGDDLAARAAPPVAAGDGARRLRSGCAAGALDARRPTGSRA